MMLTKIAAGRLVAGDIILLPNPAETLMRAYRVHEVKPQFGTSTSVCVEVRKHETGERVGGLVTSETHEYWRYTA